MLQQTQHPPSPLPASQPGETHPILANGKGIRSFSQQPPRDTDQDKQTPHELFLLFTGEIITLDVSFIR